MIEVAAEISGRAFDGVEDTEAFLDDAERHMLGVADQQQTKSFAACRRSSFRTCTRSRRWRAERDVIGLSTGFTDFDKLTGGLRGGQLVIIAARPAMGKTSLFLSMGQNIATTARAWSRSSRSRWRKEELGFRFLSGMSRIDAKRLKIGRLLDRDWPRLAQAADQLSKAQVFIDDSGDLTVMDIRSRCRRLLAIGEKARPDRRRLSSAHERLARPCRRATARASARFPRSAEI